MEKNVDINSDVGERPEALADGSEEKLIRLISSANIACGGHAGDEHSILELMKLCKKYNVGIGAHPSYPDKINFGRIELPFSSEEITQFVYYQIEAFVRIAEANGFEVRHIKPHGALYNVAAHDEKTAVAIARGIKIISKDFILYGLAGSLMIDIWRNEGFCVVSEAFADRRYEDDGSLRSRKFSDALISNPIDAANQALFIVRNKKIKTTSYKEIKIDADTICIHSDTENSIEIVKEIRNRFLASEIDISRIIN